MSFSTSIKQPQFFLASTQLVKYLRPSYVKPFNKVYLLLEMKVHTYLLTYLLTYFIYLYTVKSSV